MPPEHKSLNNAQKIDQSQDGVQRQMALEMRHQELLIKQKVLQEQYSRLQEMSNTGLLQGVDSGPDDPIVESGADSNLSNRNSTSNNSITNKIYETEIL